MAHVAFEVSEIEHEGDLRKAISDIQLAGGTIRTYDHPDHFDGEWATFFVECEDLKAFEDAFLRTDSGPFSSLAY